MEGLIEHHQVPGRRLNQSFDASTSLELVDTGDEQIVFRKGIGLAESGHHPRSQILPKLRWKTSFISRCQLFTRPAGTTISARFISSRLASSRMRSAVSIVFSQTHLIRDKEAARRRRRDAMRQDHLMRQQIDRCGGQGGSALHERKRVRLVPEPCLTPRSSLASTASNDTLRALLERLQRINRQRVAHRRRKTLGRNRYARPPRQHPRHAPRGKPAAPGCTWVFYSPQPHEIRGW